MDGEPEEMTGYFTTDFTLDEVKRLQVHLADGRTMEHLTTHSSLGVEFDKSSSFSVPTVTETAAFLKTKQQEVKDSGVSIRTPGGKKIRKAAHIPFRDDLNEEIEAAHRRWVAGEGDVVWPFHLRGRRYCIHFEYLKQINLTTDYERNVWQHEVRTTTRGFGCMALCSHSGDNQGKWYWVADENPDVGLYIETKRPGERVSVYVWAWNAGTDGDDFSRFPNRILPLAGISRGGNVGRRDSCRGLHAGCDHPVVRGGQLEAHGGPTAGLAPCEAVLERRGAQ